MPSHTDPNHSRRWMILAVIAVAQLMVVLDATIVNIALPAAIFAFRLIVNQANPQRPRIDIPGALLATTGLFALVYGFSNSETHSWGHPVTIIMLVAAVVLLGTFFLVERRVAHPLLPLRVLADRTRGGAFAGIGIAGIAMFALFLFLTYYMQRTLGFSPIETGLGFLPLSAAIIVTAQVVSQRLLPKFGPRPHMVVGMLFGTAAMLTLTQLGTDSGYVTHVLPSLILMGIGMGNIFPPAFQSATFGVDRADTGVASAMVNTMQQVGGSIGTALLSSIFASAVTSYASGRAPSAATIEAATVHGYTVAFWVAAGVFAVGAAVVAVVLPSIRIQAAHGAEPVTAH